MTKRFLSVLLAVLTVVTIIPVSVFADGDITVSTADELRRLSEAVAGGESYEGRTVVLAADIDLGGRVRRGRLSAAPPHPLREYSTADIT